MSFDYDVIIVGAGHAGTEPASMSSRLNASTLLLTSNLDTIGHMSCNPAIGGRTPGQTVPAGDAPGGGGGGEISRRWKWRKPLKRLVLQYLALRAAPRRASTAEQSTGPRWSDRTVMGTATGSPSTSGRHCRLRCPAGSPGQGSR